MVYYPILLKSVYVRKVCTYVCTYVRTYVKEQFTEHTTEDCGLGLNYSVVCLPDREGDISSLSANDD